MDLKRLVCNRKSKKKIWIKLKHIKNSMNDFSENDFIIENVYLGNQNHEMNYYLNNWDIIK